MRSMRFRVRAAWSAVLAAALGVVAVAGISDLSESPASAAVSAKHTICHRTASTTNPYRRITVSINAIYSGGSGNFKSAKHPIHNNYAFKAYDANSNGILFQPPSIPTMRPIRSPTAMIRSVGMHVPACR